MFDNGFWKCITKKTALALVKTIDIIESNTTISVGKTLLAGKVLE